MQLHNDIWNDMLSAEMNVLYWRYLSSSYYTKDRVLKIILALFSSVAVASWVFLGSHPKLFQYFSIFTAIVAVVFPFLNYQERIMKLVVLSSRWNKIVAEYEKIWRNVSSGSKASEIEKAYESIKEIEQITISEETGFSRKRCLIKKCQLEVMRARGYSYQGK